MTSVDQAYETQLKNIQSKTGKTLDQLYALIKKSGLTKHGEIREMLQRDLGLGYGDANMLANFYLKSAAGPAPSGDALAVIYAGPKAELRPIHDKLLAAINTFGPCGIAPKKTYVSLRRKKQFAMIGPVTKTRVEVGINLKGLTPTERLIELPAGGMCQYKVNVTTVEEVDQELIAWIKQAYDKAG
jgi:hypothetical protein